MKGLATSFHLLGALAFVLVSLAVSVRLIRLSRRTLEQPELLLGLGILGTAVLGYGLQITAMILLGDPFAPVITTATVAFTFAGKLFHDTGVTMILLFVLTVFRRGDRRAYACFALVNAAMWSGMIGLGLSDGYRDPLVKNAWWWLEYSVIWTYPLWPAFESLRYHRLMRRRQRLGLADPLTTNRFLLWGACSLGTFLAVATTSLPMLLADPADRVAIQSVSYLATAAFGIGTVSLYALTFFPPAWYRSWIRGADPTGAPQAA